MDLSALQNYLKDKGDPLILSAGDSNLTKPFQDFLNTVPNQQVTLSPGIDGIQLQNSTLTISGSSSDTWPVQGMVNVAAILNDITITITNETNNPTIDSTANAMLPLNVFVRTPVTIAALKQGGNPWQIKLAQDATGITAKELLLLGKVGTLPFNLPPELNQALTVNKNQFQITFYPNTTYEFRYSFALSAPEATWTLIQDGILSFKGIDLKAFVMTNSVAAVLTGHVQIDSVSLDVDVALNTGENWSASVHPSHGDAFPGLAAFATWIGGSSLSDEVSTGFSNVGFESSTFDVAIEKVSLGFNQKETRLNYLNIVSLLTVRALQLDVELRLPNIELIGSLHGNQSVKVTDVLSSVALPTADIPRNLNITTVDFHAQPKNSYYSASMTVDNIWQAGPINLEEIGLLVSYYGVEGFTGQFDCEIAIGETIKVGLVAEYAGADQGWRFEGSLEAGSSLSIADVLSYLGEKFGISEVPQPIRSLTLSRLNVIYQTGNGEFTFNCQGNFPVDDREVAITVTINITRQEDNSFTKKFGGYIIIGGLQFNLIFSKDNTAKTFLATYNNPNRDSLKIKTLVEAVSDDIATYIPANLEITLQDALFIYSKNQTKSNLLFGLNLSSKINLSNLPLAGREFPPEQTLSVNDLQFLVASQNLNPEQVNIFNNLIPDNITKLPLQPTGNNAGVIVVKKGLNVSANLQVGNTTQILALPIASDSQPTTPTPTPTPTPPPTPVTDNTQWYPLKKHLGTLYFARIGIQYKDTILWFLLDVSISAAGLTLNLEGLSVGSPIKQFQPKFNLRGIGIEYESKGAVSIEGAFLRTTIAGKDQYSGSAIVKTETFTISAIGSYTTTDQGHPSLFIYGILDKPIGGPPFFFVTGLALGFAYNRSLILPTLEQIPQFPLVRAATRKDATADPAGLLIKIQRLLPTPILSSLGSPIHTMLRLVLTLVHPTHSGFSVVARYR